MMPYCTWRKGTHLLQLIRKRVVAHYLDDNLFADQNRHESENRYSTTDAGWTIRFKHALWRWSAKCGVFLLQTNLLRHDFDCCYVKRHVKRGEFTWYRRRPKLNQKGFPTTGPERGHWVDQITALRTETCETENIEGIMPLLVHIGDGGVWACLGIVEILAAGVLLGTFFIDRRIRRTFPAECKIVLWLSKPVTINLTKTQTSYLNADNTVFEGNENPQGGYSNNESILCRVLRQASILENSQAAVCVNCQSDEVMKAETDGNGFKRRCCISAPDLVEILLGNPSYVFIEKLTLKLVNFPSSWRSLCIKWSSMHHTGKGGWAVRFGRRGPDWETDRQV